MPLRLRCSLTLHSSFLPSLLRSKRWVGTRCGLPSNTGTASPPCCAYAAWAEGAFEADIEAIQHAMAFNPRAIKRAATAEASTGDSPQATVPSVVPQPSSVIETVRRGHLSVDLPIATLRQQVTRGIARIVLSGTWVTDYSEHIGNTFGHLRGCANAVAGVFQDGRTAAVRGSVGRRREDGRAVPRIRCFSQDRLQDFLPLQGLRL